MKKIYIVLILLCTSLICSAVQRDSVVVQNIDLASDTLNKIQKDFQEKKQEEINQLTQKKEQLLKKKLEKSKLKNELENIPNTKKYIKYYQLKDSTNRLRMQIESLTNDTVELYACSVTLENVINDKLNYISELLELRETISDSLIKRFLPYLDLPFSEINQSTFKEIQDKCNSFRDANPVDQMLIRAKNLSNVYDTYTKACNQLHEKYDKSVIETLVSNLSETCDVNPVQQQEIDSVKGLLTHYEDGVKVFQKYIKRLNWQRKDRTKEGYHTKDFKRSHNYILQQPIEKDKQSTIQEGIKQFINPIPYLKTEFEKYLKILEKEPMQHPAIEQEILNIDFNE